MRISDWSSDVCSSDLARDGTLELATGDMPLLAQDAAAAWLADLAALWQDGQSRPLAFAPDAAFAWLEKLDKDDDEAAAWKAACDVIEDRQGFGDGHDAWFRLAFRPPGMRSEEHTSELQSLMRTAYAVFCLTKH